MGSVLVIEASGLLCQLIGSSPARRDLKILGARSFQAAVNSIQSETPVLILVDLDLPGKLNVEKACKLIKKVPRCKNVPMYLIGAESAGLKEKVATVGAQGDFAKPISPGRFLKWFQSLPALSKAPPAPLPQATPIVEQTPAPTPPPALAPPTPPTPPPPQPAPSIELAATQPAVEPMLVEDGEEAPKLVLLVDGGTTVLELLRAAEVYKYCAIVAAGSAQEAGVLLKAFEPTAIFIDAELPDLRGEALCRFLKSVPAYEKVPLFLMSVNEEEALEEPVFMVGAEGFLKKPFNGDDFVMFLFSKGLVALDSMPVQEAPTPEPEEPVLSTAERISAALAAEHEPPPVLDAPQMLPPSYPPPQVSGGLQPVVVGGGATGGESVIDMMQKRAAAAATTYDYSQMAGAVGPLASVPLSGNLAEQVESILQFGREKRADTVPVLIHILSGGNPDLIGEACWSLGEIADRRAVPELVMILKRPEPFCVLKTIEALGKIGDPSSVPHIVAKASECGDELKLAIVRALTRIGGTMACKGLEILSLDDNFAVATMASQSLKAMA